MNRKDSNRRKPPTIDDYKARGGFMVSKMKAGTVALIEATTGAIYTLRLLDPFTGLIEFSSTEEFLRHKGNVKCYFISSWIGNTGAIAIPDWVVKDGRMLLKFSDSQLLCHPIRSCLLEHPEWKYEVIEADK